MYFPLFFWLETSLEGLLNVNKKSEVTSFDVVEAVRRLSGERRVGHTGTLDRSASGVLVVLVGRATKIIRFLVEDEKEYIGTVRLGAATDTDDSTGRVVRRAESFKVTVDDIRNAAESFKGVIEQIPPAYSSVKIGGKRLYQLARRGTPMMVWPRKVEIRELEIVDFKDREFKIRVACSKGTYIRALARDMGEKLRCFAHLYDLVRIRVGENLLENSIDIGRVCEIEEHMMSLKDALARYPIVTVSAAGARDLRCGQKLKVFSPGDNITEEDTVRICKEDEELIAVGKIEKGMLVPVRVLA